MILGCSAWFAIRVEGLPDARSEALAKYKEGLFLGQLGKTDLAIAAIRSASELRPNDAQTHFTLGMALAGEGKPDQALQEFERVITIRPGDANRGACWAWRSSSSGSSMRRLSNTVRRFGLKPDLALAHHGRGLVLLTQEKLDQAIEAEREAIKLKPTFAEAHCARERTCQPARAGRPNRQFSGGRHFQFERRHGALGSF